jgi:tRNA pseudouridine55 synthase
MNPPFGFLNINKPLHLTSHDVIAKIRRGLGIKKAGHAGTLDPLATGVLVVCVGQATRLSEYVMHTTKRYHARIRLGVTTDTYDAEGQVIQERDASHITREAVEAALMGFLGDIEQVPPMYSAIKQAGKKLYELARSGVTVEREARHVTIHELVLLDWTTSEFTLDISCSEGTYIRSLAFDLGEKLGVGAHLAGLVRTASGNFTLEESVSLDELLNNPDWRQHLISPDVALSHIPAIHLDPTASDHILHGRTIPAGDMLDAIFARAYNHEGRFIAIVQSQSGAWRPHKVFLPQS